MLATVRRTFDYLDSNSLALLYRALVRPYLEYGHEIWSPIFKEDIELIEVVQRRATKLVPRLPYQDRLKRLHLPTLVHRRRQGDLITMFKINNGLLITDLSFEYTRTRLRGHNQKIFIQHCSTNIRKNFFINRVAKDWNSLPGAVINAPTVNSFKSRLDKFWENCPTFYDYKANY
jgi:hypothetical protein